MVRVLACCCLGVCCYAHACMILITSIITGPHQYPEKMIPKFINQLMNGKKLTVVRIFSFFFPCHLTCFNSRVCQFLPCWISHNLLNVIFSFHFCSTVMERTQGISCTLKM